MRSGRVTRFCLSLHLRVAGGASKFNATMAHSTSQCLILTSVLFNVMMLWLTLALIGRLDADDPSLAVPAVATTEAVNAPKKTEGAASAAAHFIPSLTTNSSSQGGEAVVAVASAARAWNQTSYSCQDLKVAQEPPSTLNFLASAVGQKYEDILPMYVFYALSAHRNVDAVAEIIVPDSKAFVNRNQKALGHLQTTFSSPSHPAFCVRQYMGQPAKRTVVTNTWRYLEVPARFSKYTYIGDIDIFFTESVLDAGRFQQMNEFNLSYSNIVRDYDKKPLRLTGLMLLETKRFYTRELLQAQAKIDARGNDEAFLYNIVEAAGLGIPPRNATSITSGSKTPLVKYRPQHGVHLSFNRGPGKRMCSGQLRQFDLMLQVEGLAEFRHHNLRMDGYLSEVQSELEEEKRGDMIVFDGRCQRQPRRNQNTTMQEGA